MSKDLKSIIKQYVRECLTEVFAEINLQNILENVVEKKLQESKKYSVKNVYTESVAATPKVPSISPEEKKTILMEKMGIKDDSWRAIYQDTLESESPILAGGVDSKPELVSESVLEQMGLMRDYSKHIKAHGELEDNDSKGDEWETLRDRQRQILESTIKRTR